MRSRITSLLSDFSLSTITAGLVAVLVGYSSSIAIVFQAANACGASAEQLASWMWALGIGMGLCCLLPSLWLKQPVMMAWSTPGAAVIAVSAQHYTMNEAIGAFVFSAALVTLFGITGWFEKLLSRIPTAIPAALLAGVLAQFALKGFAMAGTGPLLFAVMLLSYLLLRQRLPRYCVPITFALGIACTALQDQLNFSAVQWRLAEPIFTQPAFRLSALISLGLPLFVLTMSAQNLPGVAAIRQAGYDMPISKLITTSGVASLILAPFGGYAINLAAITAAICMSDQAHPDRAKRYTASMVCGMAYIVLGLFGAAVASLITAVPALLVATIAALALLPVIAGSLKDALAQDTDRDAAIIAFLVTLSGVKLFDIGSAFWGVVVGILALAVSRWFQKPSA